MKKETLDAMRAWLDGEMLEYRPVDSNLKWHKVKLASECSGLPFLFDDSFEYRIKPRTISIGEYDVPEPCRVKPWHGTIYYVADLDFPLEPDKYRWSEVGLDNTRLEQGRVHLTSEAAIIHAKAILSLTGGKE